MAGGYSSEDKHLLEGELCTIFPPEWLREKARDTGFRYPQESPASVIAFFNLLLAKASISSSIWLAS